MLLAAAVTRYEMLFRKLIFLLAALRYAPGTIIAVDLRPETIARRS